MSNNNYFWQGGRKIQIEQTASEITLNAPDLEAAKTIADEAGVSLEKMNPVGGGLIRATVSGDRDRSMAQLRELDNVVHHVYQTPGEPDSKYLITDTFFIKFKPETSPLAIQELLETEKLEVVQDLGQNTLLVRVTTATNRNALKTANLAAARGDVEYAEPNLVRQLQRFAFIPADELFPKQWHLNAPQNGTDLVAGASIFAPEAWDITRGSRDIVVCVIDDGFDLTHPDFGGTGKIVGKLNASERSGTVSYTNDVSPQGDDYHGTPCAGVAIAEINGQGTVGVAPGCAFLAVRFPLNFSDAAMIQLFQRISREADIVSCSWGYPPTDKTLNSAFSDTLSTLARTGGRRGKGLVICVAAGNNNAPVKDLNNTRNYQYFDQFNVLVNYSGPIDRWIAAHPDVITVSGSTSLKTRAAYSSWGKEICVCAPTNNFHDLRQSTPRGLGIVTTDNEDLGGDFTSGSRYTNRFGGTSSATPTVAGVCGLILSRNPNLTALEVKQILQQTADKDLKIESETPVNEPGDFVSGFSLWFGHGKVNAFKAVQAAVPTPNPTIDLSVTANIAIPDAGSPISSKLEVAQTGIITDLRIGVDITHTYIGDLQVDIVAPDGTSVSLHDRSGGTQNDLRTMYTASLLPALNGLVGKSIGGTWSLRVVDTWRIDVGQLNSWRLIAKVTNA
jgi:subtilisin family serine protease